MAGFSNGKRPCDYCGDPHAPFGFAPPGGVRRLKPGTRAINTCGASECQARARSRVAEVVNAFARPPAPRVEVAQASLDL
jgi:hypothetical protein